MADGDKCCKCNGPNSTCTRCSCAKNSKLCSSCIAGKQGFCRNRPGWDSSPTRQSPSPSHVSCSPSSVSDSPLASLGSSSSNSPMNSFPSTDLGDSEGHFLDDSEVVLSAYGSTLSSSTTSNNEWYPRWKTISQLSGNHYFLPKGQCGRRYIALLTEEIDFLSRGVYPSERIIVLCSVILERDKFVRSTCDIVRNLNRRMELWSKNNFDLLVQEACRCDSSLQSRRRHSEHTERVFTRLMLLGKTRAAMRWLTERSKGRTLFPSDTITLSIDNSMKTMSVIDALKHKHPPSHLPLSLLLLFPSLKILM